MGGPRRRPRRGAVSVTASTAPSAPPSTPSTSDDVPRRRRAALRLALRLYARQLRRRPVLNTASLLLPALGTICLNYLPPLAVAAAVARVIEGEDLTAALVGPYVAAFAAAMLAGQLCWRGGIPLPHPTP